MSSRTISLQHGARVYLTLRELSNGQCSDNWDVHLLDHGRKMLLKVDPTFELTTEKDLRKFFTNIRKRNSIANMERIAT